MEHAEVLYWLWLVLIHVPPFVAFFLGVWISVKLRLNGPLESYQVWWGSIPVALFTIGTLLGVSLYNEPTGRGTTRG